MGTFERASEQGRRGLCSIQLMRGVAAVMVLVLHATEVATERFGSVHQNWWAGGAGVDLFFVISGFVMSLSSASLVRRRAPAREFLKRRFERVVPIYWLVTTLKVVLLLAVPALGLRGLGGGWHVLASYLFLPSWNSFHAALPVVPVGWTLNFEMLFYAWFALALALKVRPLLLLLPALIGLASVPWVVDAGGSALLTWFHPMLLEFLLGMLLEQVWRRGMILGTGAAWVALCGGAIVLPLLPGQDGRLLRPLVWGLWALTMLAAAVGLENILGRRVPRWMFLLGDASYSIYLTHGFVLPLLAWALALPRWTAVRGMVPVVIASLVLSIGVGLAFYRWVERPLIRFFHRRRVGSPTFG